MLSKYEKQAIKKGYKIIAGIDEAGRGPLAGPVCAACVVFRQAQDKIFKEFQIRDSKKLSEKQREEIFNKIKKHPDIEYKISFVEPKIIDKINIWQATQLCWQKSFKKLKTKPDFLFIDGNFEVPKIKISQQAIVKGDAKILVCALASIVAKVARDQLMKKLHKKYPFYDLKIHKGYGTKKHFELIKKHGPSKIHRKSFSPIKEAILLKKGAVKNQKKRV